ncbi:MAG TPA: (d)CMP kinase [Bacteroidota bacterium]
MKKNLIIAIDGPAASGKTTTAKLVAQQLGYLHIDTGAMYRAFTLKVLREGVPLDNIAEIAQLASESYIELRNIQGVQRVLIDGEDVSEEVRTPEVTSAVSAVSSIPKVRAVMVREQQRLGRDGGVVLEGRDIGTVVFPNADLKFFMLAGIDARAARRRDELSMTGVSVEINRIKDELQRRDDLDTRREVSPLRQAEDAITLDTSDLSVEKQVEIVVTKAKALLEKS